jgi:anti-anti-sigma regulatory factor
MSEPAPLLHHRTAGAVTTVEGVLDELSPPVLEQLRKTLPQQGPIVLDVGGLKRINSLGVRAWCDFMKKLAGRQVTFRRCSPAFVDQLNSVSDFRADARIESFIAPYVCESSGNVFYEELTIGKDIRKGDYEALKGRRCKECPEPLVFDDLPERYLHFLAFL